ncbi:hypothetical protein BDQ17DRAFT_307816 [Cyathus striatus]|nr:hypothetical protein BDQ17DRAFT_307816 [Cyathus striatus]
MSTAHNNNMNFRPPPPPVFDFNTFSGLSQFNSSTQSRFPGSSSQFSRSSQFQPLPNSSQATQGFNDSNFSTTQQNTLAYNTPEYPTLTHQQFGPSPPDATAYNQMQQEYTALNEKYIRTSGELDALKLVPYTSENTKHVRALGKHTNTFFSS